MSEFFFIRVCKQFQTFPAFKHEHLEQKLIWKIDRKMAFFALVGKMTIREIHSREKDKAPTFKSHLGNTLPTFQFA